MKTVVANPDAKANTIIVMPLTPAAWSATATMPMTIQGTSNSTKRIPGWTEPDLLFLTFFAMDIPPLLRIGFPGVADDLRPYIGPVGYGHSRIDD